MTTNSKKAIATVAALQILLYHCWIPVFGYGTALGDVERFLLAGTYVGVDIFFFISAFSLASRPPENYWGFIKNRAVKLLPLFIIALIFGRFLWFIPSIMIMYLVFPPICRLCRKSPYISFAALIVGWAGLVYLILGVIRPSADFGLFLFRIPSIILGGYAVAGKKRTSPRQALIIGALLLTSGLVLINEFGYLHKLNYPYRGTFYLVGIPAMLGIVLLTDYAASEQNSQLVNLLGSITLELYFTQMVFGTVLVNFLFRLTGIRIITNLLSITLIVTAASLIREITVRLLRLLKSGDNAGPLSKLPAKERK